MYTTIFKNIWGEINFLFLIYWDTYLLSKSNLRRVFVSCSLWRKKYLLGPCSKSIISKSLYTGIVKSIWSIDTYTIDISSMRSKVIHTVAYSVSEIYSESTSIIVTNLCISTWSQYLSISTVRERSIWKDWESDICWYINTLYIFSYTQLHIRVSTYSNNLSTLSKCNR